MIITSNENIILALQGLLEKSLKMEKKIKNAKLAVRDGHQWYTFKVVFDVDSTKTLKQCL